VREGFTSGGTTVAKQRLKAFVERKLPKYANDRNEPQQEGSSGLSAHLHFGHISPHEVFLALTEGTGWSPEVLGKAEGKMEGFWNLSPNADPLLDQLITWREIGFNFAARERNYDRYESLPEWAQQTLAEHADDPRPAIYSLEEFTHAKTHDPLWNAAQRQLVREGRIHNYLRMLWGKKILHWTRSPQEALEVMIQLNNQFALDGRDPNSYSGIFWVLGRYDRAWGPERPIFGKIRYMTSESTASKWRVGEYIKKYSETVL
ncbi:MAG: deoxyribodipyrimidine photolyase, partial [Pirellulaceae bacterium]